MILSYFDEAGDDGFPSYASPLFTLSCLYFHFQNWQNNLQNIDRFRKYIVNCYGFPYSMELHTREFLLNKKPYGSRLRLSDAVRIEIVESYLNLITLLDVKIINVVIIKKAIRSATYDVLDRAFTYSIQRIENDLNDLDPASKFMIITDPGRVGKMRRTARKIQRYNYIPSKFAPSAYRQEIKRLIEDPLPKESNQSHFIQLADLVSFIVYHYARAKNGIGSFPHRLPTAIDDNKILSWMEIIKPKLNLKASSSDPYGVVCYPK